MDAKDVDVEIARGGEVDKDSGRRCRIIRRIDARELDITDTADNVEDAADQDVGAGPSIDRVITGISGNDVIAAQPVNRVVAEGLDGTEDQ
ncbi:hypothetical protein BWR60_03905 [Inquilinus limosus]|uniref:Uncharacterized protein n=1 Tax=Inquilinus limosus TaxID=171674 RepID=A0A211ZTM9_9PROT|nr:hypothetical protein BWR60_03905 [Inquilinus limosus]